MAVPRKFIVAFVFLFCVVSVLAAGSVDSKEFNVTIYGAVGDGKMICTTPIQKAIDACHGNGGGSVVVPAGEYRTGTLILKDHVNLVLQAGCIIVGTGAYQDFPLVHPSYRSYHDRNGYAALMYAENARDISITGLGVIDGHNKVWNHHPWLTAGTDDDGRPRNILFVSCSKIRIEGITLRNAVMWNQHYLNCKDVVVDGITVYSHGRANNDGIDIDGCRRFVIKNSVMDSDDDCLTLKSSGTASCDNILASNCVFSSYCNAIKTGTESTGGFRNVTITHCQVKPSADKTPVNQVSFRRGVYGISAITLACVDGGTCKNINISDINIEGSQSAIFIRLGKRNRPYTAGARVTKDGVMHDIKLSNIFIRGSGDLGCYVLGLPNNPIRNLSFSNVVIESLGGLRDGQFPTALKENPTTYPDAAVWGMSPAYGFFFSHAKNVAIKDLKLATVDPDARPPFDLVDVKDISMKKISAARAVCRCSICHKRERQRLRNRYA